MHGTPPRHDGTQTGPSGRPAAAAPRQRDLPLAEAEGTHADRRARLGLALDAAACDLHLRELALWVFNVTAGGTAGELTRTHAQLAARPWGLCCSATTARRTVAKARRLGLLTVEAARYVTGGQRANSYRVDWAGVAALASPGAGVHSDYPGGHSDQPPSQDGHPGVQDGHPFKEDSPSDSPFPTSGPGPEGPPPGRNGETIPDAPELRDAASLAVEPLDPGRMLYGAYKPLRPGHLDAPLAVVRWFRCQAGLERPVLPGDGPHLLLALAAADYAARMPEAEVRKNRAALFVAVVSRRRWWDCLDRVPEAARRLADLVDRHGPDLLTGPWPVPTRRPQTTEP